MSVERGDGLIRIVGDAAVEDAETLAACLAEMPGAPVDWTQAGLLHTAVIQALLVLRPAMIGLPSDEFVTRWLIPLLDPPRR